MASTMTASRTAPPQVAPSESTHGGSIPTAGLRATIRRDPTIGGGVGTYEAVRGFFESAADRLGLDASMRALLDTHRRSTTVQVRVPMDDGGLATFEGYRIQHNNALGPYKGGLRYHQTVAQDEIKC